DSSSAQIGGLEDIIQLQTKRAETDAVEVDEADLSAYDHPEQQMEQEVEVERIDLESMDETVERDSRIGIELEDIYKDDAKLWAEKMARRQGPTTTVIRENLERKNQIKMALIYLTPLLLLFVVVLLSGPAFLEQMTHSGRWIGRLSSSGGTTVEVELNLKHKGNVLYGEMSFEPVGGALPTAEQVPLAIKPYYTGEPMALSASFTRDKVNLGIALDPSAPQDLIIFELAVSADNREMNGATQVLATSELNLSLRRPR
ncbi:MAG: hypothetical protein P9M14_08800, partial [Candidatus Alcyoniella australis]|nr:hypothetical protein [Candidatus Alcyoniella australis]